MSTALLATIVGQVLLMGSAWLLPFASEHSVTADTISELVLGPYGFVQTIAFVVAGLGMLSLAAALRVVLPATRGNRASTVLLGINGVGLLVGAVVRTDPVESTVDWDRLTAGGVVHLLAAAVSFVCVVAAMVVLSFNFGRSRGWRTLTPWSALLATGSVSLLLAQGTQGSVSGLLQRLLATLIAVWVVMVAIRARSLATESHDAGVAMDAR
ncbi:DUF998 domain-containing protein [Asanoa hainanensis]|uniref:DUF998 domain-containing protein n=1 Tax=Asanoa hainanensis TaxID=560556 RepID=UPI000B76CB07|nr:DUF998 domain-containing protein [Asanoa hainanensis]